MSRYILQAFNKQPPVKLCALCLLTLIGFQPAMASSDILFTEDFENGITGWTFENAEQVQIMTELGVMASLVFLSTTLLPGVSPVRVPPIRMWCEW